MRAPEKIGQGVKKFACLVFRFVSYGGTLTTSVRFNYASYKGVGGLGELTQMGQEMKAISELVAPPTFSRPSVYQGPQHASFSSRTD